MSDSIEVLRNELAALNAEWDAITAKRKAWMDEHMPDFAKWPIGTELFHLDTGVPFGTITGYYRFHADRDARYDRAMSIDYLVTGGRNTSSLPGSSYSVGSREDLIARRESEIERLRTPPINIDNLLTWFVPTPPTTEPPA